MCQYRNLALQQCSSFDDPIAAIQQRQRGDDPIAFCGLQVDDQFDLEVYCDGWPPVWCPEKLTSADSQNLV
jgi:hypothetical protein